MTLEISGVAPTPKQDAVYSNMDAVKSLQPEVHEDSSVHYKD
jgi:hypothetical protein